MPVDTSCMEAAPCLTCPVEHMCSIDGTVSPNTCILIENWVLNKTDSSEQFINISTSD